MINKIIAKARIGWRKKRYRYSLYLGIVLGLFFLASSIISALLFGVLPGKAVNLLPDVHVPATSDRVLVLSPHCDDETLAVGGYDYEAVKAGAQVHIVLVTDCNKHGWEQTRLREFKNAAKDIGVPEKNLEFWNFKEGARDEKQLDSMQKMIKAEIKTFQPTVVFAPMTQDSHYDHYLVGKAYLEAAKDIGYSGISYGYLVHHRYYPQPKRYATKDYLTPPILYLNYGQGWSKLMLSQEAEDVKNEAVLGYRSQLRIPLLGTLLKSMVRRDEVYIKLN